MPVENIRAVIEKGLINVTWDYVRQSDYFTVKANNEILSITNQGIDANLRKTSFDASDFSNGQPFDVCIEVTAYNKEGNPPIICSKSRARINFHCEEFIPWWKWY